MTYEEIIEALRVCGRGECDGCLTPEQACGALCTEAASALEKQRRSGFYAERLLKMRFW